jgi:glutaredoxin
MNKRKKIILGAIVVGIALVGLFVYSITRQSSTASPTKDIIFFYGRECPHCKEAERFIEDNKIDQKLEFDSVEVWHNQDNADLLVQKARECGIADSRIGVPFVWSQGKCYLGTPDIEAFLKEKTGIN